MTDLLLDNTGDIVINDFALQLTPDAVGSIKQRVQIRLKAFKGEYFLDLDFGTPYHQQIFQKGISKGVVDAIFTKMINDTKGVVGVTSFTSTLDNTSRAYSASWKAIVDGDFPIEGTI